MAVAERPPWRYHVLHVAFKALLTLLARFEVTGLENIPPSGPVLLVLNHLHWLDPPIAIGMIPRPSVALTADKWERVVGVSHLLRWSRRSIYVARGEVDRKALRQCLEVLNAGEMLGIAPEGTRSPTGSLQKARTGVAYLAARTGAAIVPMAATGQEKVFATLKRLRRPTVRVTIGQPFTLPGTPNRARGEQLDAYTDEIMRRLATLLPPEYRGYYASAVEAE